MKMPNIKAKTNLAQELSYALIALILIIYGFHILADILIPLIFAGLLSFMLFPICAYLERKKIPRVLAILITILLTVGLISVLVYLSVLQVSGLEELLPILDQKAQIWIDLGQKKLQSYGLSNTKILKEGQKYLGDILKNSSSVVSNVLGATTDFLIKLSLLPLYLFLFLMYRDFLKTFLYKLFKHTSRRKIDETVSNVVDIVGHYVVGLVKVIVIIGILNTLALFLLKIDHAVFFGFFAAFLVLIPYIGIAIGAILPIIVALITKDSYLYPVGVALSFYAIQFMEGNFITPYVVGNKISINPLVAIISLLLFGKLWGMAGLVLALPLTAVIKVILDASTRTRAWGFLLGDKED